VDAPELIDPRRGLKLEIPERFVDVVASRLRSSSIPVGD